MAIVVACQCGKTLKAKPEAAGKKTKCPYCGAVITIPAESVAAAPAAAGGAASASATAAGNPDAIEIQLDWSTAVSTEATVEAGRSPGSSAAVPTSARRTDPSPDGVKQYKVLTPKEYGLPGKFNPGMLEESLNQYAREGWIVNSAVVIQLTGHTGLHDELILILER